MYLWRQLGGIEHLICSRQYAKCITSIILYSPCHRNSIVSIFIITTILQKRELEHGEVEWLCSRQQLIGDNCGTKMQVCLRLKLLLLSTMLYYVLLLWPLLHSVVMIWIVPTPTMLALSGRKQVSMTSPNEEKMFLIEEKWNPRLPKDDAVGVQNKSALRTLSHSFHTEYPKNLHCFISLSRESWVGGRNTFKIILKHEFTQIWRFNLWPYVLIPHHLD